jgi:hypothetical protein
LQALNRTTHPGNLIMVSNAADIGRYLQGRTLASKAQRAARLGRGHAVFTLQALHLQLSPSPEAFAPYSIPLT